MSRLALAGLVAVAITAPPALSWAQHPTGTAVSQNPQANARYEAGLALFDKQEYDAASREFEAAHALDPVPAMLWSWAQAERFAGRCTRAVELYRKFMNAATKPSQVTAARDMIKLCEHESARPPEPLPPPPPPPQEPPPAPAEPAAPRWYEDRVAVGLGAGGVASVALGVTFLALASSSQTRADEAMFLDEFEAALDQATSRRLIAAASFTVGAALIAAGVTVYVIHDRERRKVIAGTDGRTIFFGARF